MRVCVMVLALVVVTMARSPPFRPLSCPRPKVDIPGCVNTCQAKDKPGFFYCCDSKGLNAGTCPKVHLQPYERNVLCDRTQFNYPNHLNCKDDEDCQVFEKCCYLPDNHQLICRNSEDI
uniref:Pl-crustin 1 n=1 Tax=Pacifastacus leniusculus TaxID=6720 RepID=A5A3L1_PACLE|nr:Pl-crustin 1 [Pacifastacus leniusculus]